MWSGLSSLWERNWMMMIAYRIFAGKATALSVICSPHNNSFWVHSQLSASSEYYLLFCYFYQNASQQPRRDQHSPARRYTDDTNYHNWNREHEEWYTRSQRFLSQNKARLGSGQGWALGQQWRRDRVRSRDPIMWAIAANLGELSWHADKHRQTNSHVHQCNIMRSWGVEIQ